MTANAGTPDPMGADPELGAGIGNMAEDPNAGMPAEDPGMGGEDMGGEAAGPEDDSTASIIDQLSDDDKEAVRNYAESLLNRDENQSMGGGMEGTEAPAAPAPQPGVMMEITKGRLKMVQKRLQEVFRSQEEDDETERKQKKVGKPVGKKTPFDSPLD